MKKLTLFFLCFSLFVFSNEENTYEKTISFSKFAQGLKEAADKGLDYILEDCYITYDSIIDKKYIKYTVKRKEKIIKKFVGDMQIKNLAFKKSTKVHIKNCRFGENENSWFTTITFYKCSFDSLFIENSDVTDFIIDSSEVTHFNFVNLDLYDENPDKIIAKRSNQITNWNSCNLTVKQSKINTISCSGNYWDSEQSQYRSLFRLNSSDVNNIYCNGFHDISIIDNKIKYCLIKKSYTRTANSKFSAEDIVISNNEFLIDSLIEIYKIQLDLNNFTAQAFHNKKFGLDFHDGIRSLTITNNTFKQPKLLSQSSILKISIYIKIMRGRKHTFISYDETTKDLIGTIKR